MFTLKLEEAIHVIDYVDGDGGHLTADLIAGFQRFVDSLQVQSLDILTDGGHTLVAFRKVTTTRSI